LKPVNQPRINVTHKHLCRTSGRGYYSTQA
jgi:hypothetical protein